MNNILIDYDHLKKYYGVLIINNMKNAMKIKFCNFCDTIYWMISK